jgi:hypothetical protein
MPDAPSAACIRTSSGNRTLLVLADSSQPEALHLPEALYAALGHWGMPYQILDLAESPLQAARLADHAAVVIAQEHLGSRLSAEAVAALLRAVEDGLGLVNCDHDLEPYGAAYRDAFGLAGTGIGGKLVVDGVEHVGLPRDDHYLTHTRDAGSMVALRQPLPMLRTRVGGETVALAETPDGSPLLVATRLGRGKAVQWLLSPKVWTHPYLGHARGLDDLLWKGIAWAARKPFVMKALPPFVRARFDDCFGWWRDGADLDWVDILNGYGHVPNLAVCMRAVTPDGAARLRALVDAGRAEVAPHTLQPATSIFFGDERWVEYSEGEFRAIVDEVKGLLRRWGIRPSPILSDHDHGWSWRVVPMLGELGIEFKMNITLPGERWEDVHVDWRPAPYGSMDYALDYLPDPLGHLFVVFNHYPAFEYARAYLPDGRFLYNRAGGFGPYKWDFLNGLVTYQAAQASNQVEAAARRLADHTRLALDSLFFGGSISHSHFVRELSPADWRDLLDRYEALTARHEKRNVGYDHVAYYARSHVDSHLAHADVGPDGTVRCRLEGRATVPLELYVFRDVDGAVEHRYEPVPAFSGAQEVSFAGSA